MITLYLRGYPPSRSKRLTRVSRALSYMLELVRFYLCCQDKKEIRIALAVVDWRCVVIAVTFSQLNRYSCLLHQMLLYVCTRFCLSSYNLLYQSSWMGLNVPPIKDRSLTGWPLFREHWVTCSNVVGSVIPASLTWYMHYSVGLHFLRITLLGCLKVLNILPFFAGFRISENALLR